MTFEHLILSKLENGINERFLILLQIHTCASLRTSPSLPRIHTCASLRTSSLPLVLRVSGQGVDSELDDERPAASWLSSNSQSTPAADSSSGDPRLIHPEHGKDRSPYDLVFIHNSCINTYNIIEMKHH